MRRWNLILRVFMSEYLNLHPDDVHRPQIARKSNGELVSSLSVHLRVDD
jgi:hypothetical protein